MVTSAYKSSKMLTIVILKGGFGNQLFQYANIRRIQEFDSRTIIILDATGCFTTVRGCCLSIFDPDIRIIKISKVILAFFVLLRLCKERFSFLPVHFVGDNESETSRINEGGSLLVVYDGYYQNLFTANKLTPLLSRQIEKKFGYCNIQILRSRFNIKDSDQIVAVQVRRGDFHTAGSRHAVCTKDWYNEAIAYVRLKLCDCFFLVYTDDNDWARSAFSAEDLAVFNIQCSDLESFAFMSQSDNIIISNSSFGYWCAMLIAGRDNNPLVVCPSSWYLGVPTDSLSLVPSSWRMLP